MLCRLPSLLALLLLCASCSSGAAAASAGAPRTRGVDTGWFRTQKLDGRWWLADPQGRPFFLVGANEVRLAATGDDRAAVLARYGNSYRWAAESVPRLQGWGFTAIGARSDYAARRQQLPYLLPVEVTPRLRLAEGQTFPDVFSPAFVREAKAEAQRVCRSAAADPLLLGYLADTGLRWTVEEGLPADVFTEYLRLGDFAPGRAALVNFLEERYLQIADLNEAWHAGYGSFVEVGRVPQVGATIPSEDKEEFLRVVAEQYFRVLRDAIRAVDASHLIIGGHFSAVPPTPVLDALRTHADVVSVNSTGARPPVSALRRIYQQTKLPLLVSEFSLPEPEGVSAEELQGEWGRRYERAVGELSALPMVVGYCWAHHRDFAAAGGAPTGGLVTARDEPHAAFVAAVARANREAPLRHAGRKLPRKLTSAR